MTSEEKEMLQFAKMQRFANGSHDETDLLEIFGEETSVAEPAKLTKFDPETRSFLIESITEITKPLISEITRLTNLGKSEKEVETDNKKLEEKAELTEFAKMQAEINRVD
jgi:hypothetical protein